MIFNSARDDTRIPWGILLCFLAWAFVLAMPACLVGHGIVEVAMKPGNGTRIFTYGHGHKVSKFE